MTTNTATAASASGLNALTAALAAYLTGLLKPGLDPATYAIGLLAEADLSQPKFQFEVRGFHAASGNPLPATFCVPADVQADFAAD